MGSIRAALARRPALAPPPDASAIRLGLPSTHQEIHNSPDRARLLGLRLAIGVLGFGRFVVVLVVERPHRRRHEHVGAEERPGVSLGLPGLLSAHRLSPYAASDPSPGATVCRRDS